MVRVDARSNLISFANLVNPKYQASWHHEVIADHLEAAAAGDITRLIITTSPRAGKSEICTRCFPAWYMGRYPDREVVVSGYSASIANDFCRDFRRICDGQEYGLIFPGTKLPTPKDKGWVNKADTVEIVGSGGVYRSVGVSGSLTGKGADLAIIDDPIKNRDEAYSPTYRERVWGWYQSTLRTRLQGNHAAIVIIMTRWHQDDLVGRLLRVAEEEKDADQWTVVELPAINVDGPSELDPRQPGEPLWPARYDDKFLAQARAGVGEAVWQSLYQCRPTSEAGEIVRREWISKFEGYPDFDQVIQAWDLNFGKVAKSVKSSYVSGQCWGRIGSNYYLLDSLRGKWTHTENKRMVKSMHKRWAHCCEAVYIEDAASGAPLIDDLKKDIPGLVPVKPSGSKVARFESVAPLFEAGQVFVPAHGSRWVGEWIEEITSFPGAPNDDQADACAMALSKLSGRRRDYKKFRAPTGGTRIPKRLT